MSKSTLTVTVGHFGEGGTLKKVPVNSMEEASKVCQDYIEENYLGGSTWRGGNVHQNGKKVAMVSYNGSVWATGAGKWTPETKEILF